MKLAHCTPWPEVDAARYRAQGHWTGQSFAELLTEITQRHGERTAVVAGDTRWSYRQFEAQTLRLARGFAAIGIEAGERVVVQLPNRAEFLAVIFGLWRFGALPVFALPAHRRLEISYFCHHTEAAAYITTDLHAGFDYRQLAHEVRAEAPSLRHVLIAGEPGSFTALSALPQVGALPLPPDAGEVAFLQLSGGSTGTPKLIPRTHDDYLYSVRESARICGLTPETVFLCVLPAAHNFALSSPGLLGVLYAGGTVVLSESAAPEQVFPLIARERVTMTAVVPPLVPVWLAAAASRRTELATLRLLQVGGARFDDTLARRVEPELGARLQQVFGMAEGLVNYTRLDDPPDLVAQTQGRPISLDDEIRIVDDEDQAVPEGEVGHLLTRGPYTIRGYYKADAHNARAFTTEGFYRTGDRVRRLPSGHLVVEGRTKDQINRGGEKVSAEEMEHLLMAHSNVVDAALVAMPDVHLGERSCAFVIRRDAQLRAAALLQFVRAQGVAAFKVPDRIEFVDELPKTAVGKVDKKLLRQRITEQLVGLSTAIPS
ncbi:(2,3-dihydroxybenzoyl)adenylate synthase [Verminephrobacter aporrectodeae subsp. tuberculatae]|uniref:(2,3-dihydroxybenzoyl)adenylate synthase n=1 Tax=Verminephrobacter aporrectodeae TaxID=1110389 RepID=UPI002237D576|nr:(2,3-dihydroxybenzoyl)adenylate synthase [Verminephrobacter aporrectodeae]MCW5256025.1 (2,3-dihydroxybenzoyl)adenylate synthase [Verminephrobacter aporrectodeae subsp. tuberculatae]